ncbi:MAG TPA: MBOAT family O-acyltransferase, partial [Spongiibacteraceae bacterium]|nr:MBOAT family O-acyltransferase [Spongiibacteraceae bacterium]
IAGPIVHHKDLMPQFAKNSNLRIDIDNISLGLFIFCIGLVKKVLVADNLGQWANAGYASESMLTICDAWATSLLYSMQLYFDFSGYSDMAIGLGLMFNILLPVNFNSPYRATNIQEFWRRWHMTLSRWLRDYIYIPLGGKRAAVPRIYVNLFVTFLIGGIWHGAGWTFVVWGALHGAAVVVHRRWRELALRLPDWLGWALTLIFVNFAWVLFRAKDMAAAQRMLASMLGLAGTGWGLPGSALLPKESLLCLGIAGAMALFPLNTQQLAGLAPGARRIRFRRGICAAILVGFALFYALVAQIQNAPTQFLYFNF